MNTIITTMRRQLINISFLMLGIIMGWATIQWITESDPLARSVLIGIPACMIFGYVSTRLILIYNDAQENES